MKILFFGSDDFSVPSLVHLIQSDHEVLGCVTQPDRKRGRGHKVQYSLLKETALQYDIPVIQPEGINNPQCVYEFSQYGADIFVVVAYGQILSQEILNIPTKFCVNVHASLLPKYRGAAPINWPIINGDAETGVTIQRMVKKLDAGDIISQDTFKLNNYIGSDVLRAELAKLGAQLLITTLDLIANDKHSFLPQDEAQATYAAKLDKSMGYIDWAKDAESIERLVRGLKPWPGTFTYITGLRLKILEAEVADIDIGEAKPGEILGREKNGFMVAAGKGALFIKKVHVESSRPADAGVFMASYPPLPAGFRLG